MAVTVQERWVVLQHFQVCHQEIRPANSELLSMIGPDDSTLRCMPLPLASLLHMQRTGTSAPRCVRVPQQAGNAQGSSAAPNDYYYYAFRKSTRHVLSTTPLRMVARQVRAVVPLMTSPRGQGSFRRESRCCPMIPRRSRAILPEGCAAALGPQGPSSTGRPSA